MHLNFIQKLIVWAVPTLFAITVHEVAHGFVALCFGDKTAQRLGRLSLDPFRHIDLFGTIILPLIFLIVPGGLMFGWAKPVPVNESNFKKPRLHMALVALSGPLANILMALAWGLCIYVGVWIEAQWPFQGLAVQLMGAAGIFINLSIAIFNLLPIPPLDGGKVLECASQVHFQWVQRYGFWLLLILMMSGVLNRIAMPLLTAGINGIALVLNLDLSYLMGVLLS